MKLNKKGGFTLIEIMIVIVIISLLAVTLVPKLTGAQARSRDTSRASSLLSMKSVITVYNDDYGEFPKSGHSLTANGNGCLSSDYKGTTAVLKDYVDGGVNAKDPQKTSKVANCNTLGSFSYNALSKNGSARSTFVLAAQTETYQKSNTYYTSARIAGDGTTDIDTIVGAGKKMDNTLDIATLKTKDDSLASSTIYIVTGG